MIFKKIYNSFRCDPAEACLAYCLSFFKQSETYLGPYEISLREKCPNTKLFLVRIFLYSARIQENTNQK